MRGGMRRVAVTSQTTCLCAAPSTTTPIPRIIPWGIIPWGIIPWGIIPGVILLGIIPRAPDLACRAAWQPLGRGAPLDTGERRGTPRARLGAPGRSIGGRFWSLDAVYSHQEIRTAGRGRVSSGWAQALDDRSSRTRPPRGAPRTHLPASAPEGVLGKLPVLGYWRFRKWPCLFRDLGPAGRIGRLFSAAATSGLAAGLQLACPCGQIALIVRCHVGLPLANGTRA